MQTPLYKFCLYLAHNEALAQDLCQEALIRMLEKLKTLDKPERFESWVFRIAKNLYLDWRKSPKSSGHINIDDVDPGELRLEPEKQDQVLTLMKGLSQLETDDKAVIILVDIQGHSYQEAGEIMGLTESAVRSRLHRARQALEITLKKN